MLRKGSEFLEYANRCFELEQIEKFIRDGKKTIIIDAYHASGVTSFIKEKVMRNQLTQNLSVLYLDAANGTPLKDLLFEELLHLQYLSDFQKMIDAKIGQQNGTLFSTIIQEIPHIGSLLGHIFQEKSAAPVYTGNYASAVEGFLIPYFSEYTGKRFLLIIDGVEELPEVSYDLLVKLQQCNTFQSILIKTKDTDRFTKLKNYLFSNSVDTMSYVYFNRPEVKLVRELGYIYGVEVGPDEAQKIVTQCEQNIHAIIGNIREYGQHVQKNSLNEWEKAIIHIIDIWTTPIPEIDLVKIVKCSHLFAQNKDEAIKSAIQSLLQQGIISTNGVSWSLSCHYNPFICGVLNDFADKLTYKNITYKYMQSKEDDKCSIETRYRLSKELRCTSPEEAKLYLRHSLIMGTEVTNDVLINACLDKNIRFDCLLGGIYYCRERKYENALTWIEAIPIDQRDTDINALIAMLLERSRKTTKASEALTRCLECSITPAQQNLLGASLISNYIHMEEISMAQGIYNQMKDLYPHAPMHGYLVRNAISAFSEYRNDLYEVALANFHAEGDNFGYYTTLCNKGYSLCKRGKYDEGLQVLMQAESGLKVFSQINLHIIYNDLGICYFMLNQLSDAYKYLKLASSLAQNTMPHIFAETNLACVEAVMGYTTEALIRLNAIQQDVEQHKLDRVRQKYYPNRLMVEYLHNNTYIDGLIEIARKYPDRYTPEHTQKVISIYEQFVSSTNPISQHTWKELYSPCGLAYWYIDPLKLLPAGII